MGLGGWRRAGRRLGARPVLSAVFEELVSRLVAMEPVAIALFGSAHAGERPVDRWSDLDLAIVVADARAAAELRRRMRRVAAEVGDVVAWAWWGDQGLGVLRRDGEVVGVDLYVVERARLAKVGRTKVRAVFDPSGVIAAWRGPRGRRAAGARSDAELAIALAWRARVRVARGDRAEADELLAAARRALVPELRRRSGARATDNPRGLERDLGAKEWRAFSRCRPKSVGAAELLRAVAATERLARSLG